MTVYVSLLFSQFYIFYACSFQPWHQEKNSTNEEVVIHNHSVPTSLLFVAIGLAGVIIGGNLVVDNATLIAKAFGMSQTLIGLTIVAIGTSLPELVTSIVASKKGENDMALGNVIGSNIFNLLLVLGVAGTVSPIHLPNMESVYRLCYSSCSQLTCFLHN